MNHWIKMSSLVGLMILVLSTGVMAQSKKKQVEGAFDDKSKLSGIHVGGYVMGAYNRGWQFDISPSVGYRLLPWLISGVGFNYSYASRYDYSTTNDKLSTTTIAPKAFVKANVSGGYYGLVEYQYSTFNVKYEDAAGNNQTISVNYCEDNTGRGSSTNNIDCINKHENVLFLGAGTATNFGNGFGIYSEFVIDVLYDRRHTPRPAPYALRLGLFYTFP